MSGCPTKIIDARRFALSAALLLVAQPSFGHGVQRLVNGLWYDGSGFVAREFYSVDGVLRDTHDGEATPVDLEGSYVVPGFGDAHTHAIGGEDFAAESERFLAVGVMYVANPNGITSRTTSAREKARSPETVDARFSNGGLTSSGGHPIQLFEGRPGRSTLDGNAYFVIDDAQQLEKRWPEITAGDPDFLKIYLERSEDHAKRMSDPDFFGKRGLDPALVRGIIQRATAAGLRVAAHVTSRYDFVVAVESGVQEIAHLPLERLTRADAELAASRGTVVVTTALSHRPAPNVDDLDAVHRHNLSLLSEAGVALVLGTDSQATVVDEVHKLGSLNVLENAELVRMLVHDTPRWIFPGREIGRLIDGAEASVVLLDGNPLEDLSALRRVRARIKKGHRIELDPSVASARKGVGQHLVHLVMARGIDAAIAEYHRLRETEPDQWDFAEGQLNALGYALMQHGKLAEATEIFRLNCEQFPKSSNVWDSLGESYMERGQIELAIENYERALEIDPNSENARTKLRELRAKSP